MQSDEEKRRQSGPGLVVIDCATDSSAFDETETARSYFVQRSKNGCELVVGGNITNPEDIVGRVLFLCRPPARTAAARLNSYALMSV